MAYHSVADARRTIALVTAIDAEDPAVVAEMVGECFATRDRATRTAMVLVDLLRLVMRRREADGADSLAAQVQSLGLLVEHAAQGVE